jgi:aminopeptidase N
MRTPSFCALSLLALFCIGCLERTSAQPRSPRPVTRADTLRGMLTPLRTCYDVTFYHLDVRVDPEKRFVSGSNATTFRVVEPFLRMQIDLYENMRIKGVTLDDEAAPLKVEREFNAVFIDIGRRLELGTVHTVTVEYEGQPQVAMNPPWGGGFTWEKDKVGNPWVVVTCQGAGASLWWPNKDHQSDEPDSMLISIAVPPGLEDVSNGRLRAKTAMPDGWTRYDWFVSYPINNYNVTVNIGRFSHFSDVYTSGRDTLDLDYYVMPENLEKATVHFQQVKPMLGCFEKYFGKFPFWHDGYKLIECPHTGMEHQTAVAYGNWYIQGYRGRASSSVGLKFDFIIIHESSHEYWGNSVTAKDVADMWIHESFGAYTEALYVECLYGREESLRYINAKKQNVGNQTPIIGQYNVNRPGSGDMYDKGQLVLNTLRSVLGNDSLWFAIIKGLAETFKYRSVTAEDVIAFINTAAGKDLTYFFDQYLRNAKAPQLQISLTRKGDKVTARYRWNADVEGFRMPVKVTTGRERWGLIEPTTTWQTVELGDIDPAEFKVAEDLFYIDLRVTRQYLDPQTPEFPRQRRGG